MSRFAATHDAAALSARVGVGIAPPPSANLARDQLVAVGREQHSTSRARARQTRSGALVDADDAPLVLDTPQGRGLPRGARAHHAALHRARPNGGRDRSTGGRGDRAAWRRARAAGALGGGG